ncbi:MAG: hypothetical protein KDA65_13440, partial [Planctomycetaceae bacterium]|nr:hypothetical protein [Planctomycetaceae bacterium]
PQLTADEIRDFQTELHELIPELTNLSLMVKSSQLMLEKELQNHLRKYRLDNLLTGEPEAAFRMLKLTTANWLEYCDQPADNLSHLRVHSCSGDSSNLIPYPLEKKVEMHGFDVGENRKCIICYFENPADEEDLIDHFHSLYYSRLFLSQYFSEMNLRLLAKQDLLHMVEIDEVRLALHGFYREQGRFPDKLNELVPGWFTETPDFYLEHYQGDAYHLLRTVEGGLHSGRYGSTITKPKEQE